MRAVLLVVVVSLACTREPPPPAPVEAPPVAEPAPVEAPVAVVAPIVAPVVAPVAAAPVETVKVIETPVTEIVDAEPQLPRRLTMYGASWCGYCKKARAWFAENNVPFTELDVDQPANNATMHALFPGQKSVGIPVIDWDGTLIAGFGKEQMEDLLYPDGRKVQRTSVKRSWESTAPRDLNAMYTYTDNEGAMHIVKGMDEVPPKYRASAKKHASY